MSNGFRYLAVLISAFCALIARGGYTAEIALDHVDGIYRSGETAVCRVLLIKDGKPLKDVPARLIVKREGRIVDRKEFTTTGESLEFTRTVDKPGWLYFGFEVLGADGKALRGKNVQVHPRKPTIVGEIGALFDPDKLVSPVREPADFDEFWAKRIAEVAAVTEPPTLKKLDSGVAGVKLYAVTIPCPRGVTATGYLAYPENAAPKSLPGYMFFQALTYTDVARRKAVERAKDGALAFAATWHGFPVGKSKKDYDKVLHDYYQVGQKGLGDREKWVYSDIFFRVLSELRFLGARPEWDGRTLIVHGISLGGILSTFAAAIDPAVTTAVIGVPSFCECNAFEAGRTPHSVYRRGGIERLKEHPELVEAGFYYDAVNFARRIKCETFVFTGFADESCYPSNVFAFYNAIPATTKKSMSTDPRIGHFNTVLPPSAAARLKELTTISRQPEEAR